MTISFEGKVAIVTGAGGGLGRAYALELAKRGAKVVVNDLGGSRDGTGHSDAALQVVEEIRAAGGEAMPNGASVTEFDQMVEMVAETREAWGGVHVLVNNAGILRDKSFTKMDPLDFEIVVRVHLLGSAYATKAVWDLMREQNYGRILMTTSPTGMFGNFGQANYGAAKAGLIHLTKTMAMELARNGIRVNVLCPGYIETEMNAGFWTSKPGLALIARIPQRRIGKPEDLDGALYLLCSDASRNMTGSSIVVDGGHLCSTM